MPGEWEKPKYHQKYRQNPKYNQDPKYRQNPKYNQDPAIRKSINKYYELRDGVLKYLAEEGCIVTECDTINPNELKTDFGKYVNAINKLTENTIKMNQQLDEKSEIDEYSIQNFKKDNEEILKEKDEILKEIEDCKEKMNMDKLLNRGNYSIKGEVTFVEKNVRTIWKVFGVGNEFTIEDKIIYPQSPKKL